MKKIASNIVDLLWNTNTRNFLSVNGFSERGSDYDRFAKLCGCAEQDPDAPIVSWMQAIVNSVLPRELPICTQNVKEIWKQSAERFLTEEIAFSEQNEKTRTFSMPCENHLSEDQLFVLNDLEISAESWHAWKNSAWNMTLNALQNGKIPTVLLPKGLSFQKCDLYRAERHLTGIEKNADLWCAQLVYFLCEFCSENRLRGGIVCLADLQVFCQILQYVSKLTPLSELLLQCENQNFDALLEIATIVSEKRKIEKEGIPPMLLIG